MSRPTSNILRTAPLQPRSSPRTPRHQKGKSAKPPACPRPNLHFNLTCCGPPHEPRSLPHAHGSPARPPANLTPFPLQETRYARSLGPMLQGAKRRAMVWAVGTERVKHRVGQGSFPLLTAGLLVEGGRGMVHAVSFSSKR